MNSIGTMRSQTFKMALGWVLTVLVLNVIALRIDLYYLIPWFDVLMHALGGVVLGILGAGWARARGYVGWKVIGFGLLMGIVGGVAWEVMEFMLDIMMGSALAPSMSDTFGDLVSDTIGALIGSILIRRRL
jgi:VanZ family protein